MLPKRLLTRIMLSWAAAALGIAIGLYGLVMFGISWVDPDPNSSVWLTSRLGAAGHGILGLGFLAGSFVALRSRRRAGLIFLCCCPVAVFPLTYPEAGYLVWKQDGSGVFELPLMSTALVLTFVFYLPFIAPLFAIRNKKRAIYIFLISAAIATLAFATSRWTAAWLPRLAAWSALFWIFAGFWLRTHKLGWPALFSRPRSPAKRVAIIVFQCLLVVILDLLGTFAWAAFCSSLATADCGGPKLFVKPLNPKHVVLTARLIRVGHKVKVAGRWAGDWAIGVVQESFWGLPAWTPRLVFISNQMSWEGETYFISGSRALGILTHFLPIVDARPCGSHFYEPLADAQIYVRLLRNPTPAGQLRIIGCVRAQNPPENQATPRRNPGRRPRDQDTYEWMLNGRRQDRTLPKARIQATSATWNSVVTTDEDGVYDIVGPPPDNYTLRLLDIPPNQVASERLVRKEDLIKLVRLRVDIQTEWDGSIEGTVTDVSGKPAHVLIELRHPDGTPGATETSQFITDTQKGHYRFSKLPVGGRFVLAINSFGPDKESPYASFHHPPAANPEHAGFLEITAENQHVQDVDFTLRPLQERKLHVRAVDPTGHPISGAYIHVAYEHTRAWDDLTASDSGTTGQNGTADIPVFGDFRIRVYAQQFLRDWSLRYSEAVELDTTKLPQDLDLTISSSKVRLAH